MPAKRYRVLSAFVSVIAVVAGVGWLVQGLRAWDFFETMTGAYTLLMAAFLGFGHRLTVKPAARSSRAPDVPEVSPEGPEQPSTTHDH